jgi:hypothetical protein
MRTFYQEVTVNDGIVLNHYPEFDNAPPTMAFDLSRDLEIVERMRTVTEAGINAQIRSYEKEGEFQPVLIRLWTTGAKEGKGAKHARIPRLIDGAHRIEAARRLKLETIAAWLVECTDDEAKAMEIASNTFRTDLTPAEKGQHMVEWCRLHGLPLPDESDAPAATDAVAPKTENVSRFSEGQTGTDSALERGALADASEQGMS